MKCPQIVSNILGQFQFSIFFYSRLPFLYNTLISTYPTREI
jgi:hypothetical protein